MTIVIGGDLASASGLCYGRPATTPTAETVRGPITGDDLGRYGLFFWKKFNAVFAYLESRLEPGETIEAVIEAPILPRPKWNPEKQRMEGQTTIQTTRKLMGLGMIFETVVTYRVEEFGSPINCSEVNLKRTKNELCGKGNATKPMMVQAARRAGIVLPPGDDAYDAADGFAAWLCGVKHKAPEHYDTWMRRVWGASMPQERLSAVEARSLFPRR